MIGSPPRDPLLMAAGAGLAVFDEHAVVGPWVHEADPSGDAVASLFVDHLYTVRFEASQVVLNIVGFEAYVMHATLLLKEASDACPLAYGFKQLELSVTQAQERRPHALFFDHGVEGDVEAEYAGIERQSIVHARDDDSHVVYPFDQGQSPC